MRTVCCVCGVVKVPGNPEDGESHGICASCAAKKVTEYLAAKEREAVRT